MSHLLFSESSSNCFVIYLDPRSFSSPLLLFLFFLPCSSFLDLFFLPFLFPFPFLHAELVIQCSFTSIHWVLQGVYPGLGIPLRYSSLREYQVIAKHPEGESNAMFFSWMLSKWTSRAVHIRGRVLWLHVICVRMRGRLATGTSEGGLLQFLFGCPLSEKHVPSTSVRTCGNTLTCFGWSMLNYWSSNASTF